MHYNNIPGELRRLPQWVVSGEDKIPLNPRNGQRADVTNPETWGTFAQATQAGRKHIGFVLAKGGGYSIIDLDDPKTPEQAQRHAGILEASESYAEVSQSGKGVHIIVKGTIPKGVRRDCVEVYSDTRYMICTGDVLQQRPICDRQELLDVLYREMDSGVSTIQLTDEPETDSDAVILERARLAKNATKFKNLWEGFFTEYPSQSEADFALMSMLCFYSKCNEQCRRLFRQSELGQRSKAQHNRYLDPMLAKIRAHDVPRVDFTALLERAQVNAKAIVKSADNVKETPDAAMVMPGGLVGRLAQYIQNAAVRPVPEIALCASLGLVAGIAGRAYNISGVGLNQYIILIAKTGSGKEGMASGINALMSTVRQTVPMVDRFLGPAMFASGPALTRVLDTRPCFVSILGEIGLTLKQMTDPRAHAALIMLKRMLLDIYSKSGFKNVLHASVYSDTEKNTKMIQAPSVTILGETTPDTFYDGLDASHITDGLIPRFSIIEYKGPRPALNPRAGVEPSEELIAELAALCVKALAAEQNTTCQTVAIQASAQHLLDAFEVKATACINEGGSEVEAHLWNRAHLKALKLSALLAVGCDMENPVVDATCAAWAIAFVSREIESMRARFKRGDIGDGEGKQEQEIKEIMREYLRMGAAQRKGYDVATKMLEVPAVPFSYIRRRTRLLATFKNDRLGSRVALRNALAGLIEDGSITEVPKREALDNWGATSPVYTLNRNNLSG